MTIDDPIYSTFENMTNGEVMNTLFPNITTRRIHAAYRDTDCPIDEDYIVQMFDSDWWNSKYKKGE